MKQLKSALLVILWLSILCGLVYPLAITGIVQVLFPVQSNASLIKNDDSIIGSQWIGQSFIRPEYFHGRPSAIDPPYDASNSQADNLAPSSAKLLEQTKNRVAQLRRENGLSDTDSVPADLALTSASGLDPHISPSSAFIQAKRIAEKRNMPVAALEALIRQHTELPLLGIWGKERVNVLKLNLALDGIKTSND